MYARIYTHVSFTKIYKRENVYVYTYIYIYMCIYTYNVYIPIYRRFILKLCGKGYFIVVLSICIYVYVYIHIYIEPVESA